MSCGGDQREGPDEVLQRQAGAPPIDEQKRDELRRRIETYSGRNSWEREKLYHVMNSTCIHLRIKGLNIYMYSRERIYKETSEEIQ
jgi:hypothetical protein